MESLNPPAGYLCHLGMKFHMFTNLWVSDPDWIVVRIYIGVLQMILCAFLKSIQIIVQGTHPGRRKPIGPQYGLKLYTVSLLKQIGLGACLGVPLKQPPWFHGASLQWHKLGRCMYLFLCCFKADFSCAASRQTTDGLCNLLLTSTGRNRYKSCYRKCYILKNNTMVQEPILQMFYAPEISLMFLYYEV